MTKLLYLADCYLKEFQATVVSTGEDGLSIILDQTGYYPLSGGQPNDTGIMMHEETAYKVVDAIKKEGEVIHKIDKPGLKQGDVVQCSIDWQRRYILMRYHSAAHILSSLINNELGAEITGNQLYLDKARVDFSLERFDRELMKSFEQKANTIIAKGIPINFRILNREEAFKIPSLVKLRMQLPEHIQDIRIVDICSDDFDFDHQACGGTHVSNTKEIGPIDIFELENKGKDRKRIYFSLKAT